MENYEIQNLFKDIKTGSISDIAKLESIIGKEKKITEDIIDHINKDIPVSSELLNVCSLLLVENRNCVIEVVQNILKKNPKFVYKFITNLQSSKFYNQRMAVPKILCGLDCDRTKDFLKKSFYDDTGLVVREAVHSLSQYKKLPLSDDELLEIAMNLNNHQYDFIQCLVPDIIIYIKQKTFLLSEISLSKSWRKRLSMVRKVSYFHKEEKRNIYNIMCKDSEESIRVALVEQMDCLDDFKEFAEIFIKDTSEKVRGMTVRKIGNHEGVHNLLNNVVNDPSWKVRKELLCIHKEDIYERISLPIIKSLPKNFDWRIKIEILETILHIVDHNDILVQRCLLDTLFEYLIDPVYEVRNKASKVFKDLIEKSTWSDQLKERLDCLISQTIYLIRITLVEPCISFDKKYNTKYVINLLNDKVINVRMRVLHVLKKEDLNEEIIKILGDMKEEELREDIERLL